MSFGFGDQVIEGRGQTFKHRLRIEMMEDLLVCTPSLSHGPRAPLAHAAPVPVAGALKYDSASLEAPTKVRALNFGVTHHAPNVFAREDTFLVSYL